MEKSFFQDLLKLTSIFIIILGSIMLLVAVVIFIPGLLEIQLQNQARTSEDLTYLAVIVLFPLIEGVIGLALGIRGLRCARNPQKIGSFVLLCVVALAWAVLSGLMSLESTLEIMGSVPSFIISVMLPLIMLALAYRVKHDHKT